MKAAATAVVGVIVAGLLLLGVVLFGDDEPAVAAPSGGSGKVAAKNIPAKYRAAIATAAKRCDGITAPVLAAQIAAESGWNPSAVSPVGAQGIAQFMPGTWAAWGKDYSGDGAADPRNAEDAIGSQADYMCHLRGWVEEKIKAGVIDGDPLQLTLAAYNAGLGRVEQAGGVPAISETTAYVKRILAGISRYSDNSGSYDAGGGPTVSADGTYREARGGSGKLDTSNLCQLTGAPKGLVLRCDAADAFKDLSAAYKKKFGTNLGVTDAYRDYASQVYLKATKGYLAATPGWSNHGWGLALDLAGLGAEGTTRHAWLRKHAPAYGWQHPSWARVDGRKPEAWHWEYVGTD